VQLCDCGLDGLDLEVETNEGEDEALEVLHEVVEGPQTFRVPVNKHEGY